MAQGPLPVAPPAPGRAGTAAINHVDAQTRTVIAGGVRTVRVQSAAVAGATRAIGSDKAQTKHKQSTNKTESTNIFAQHRDKRETSIVR